MKDSKRSLAQCPACRGIGIVQVKGIDMVCPECKREVRVEMGDDKLGKELLCQECGKHAVTPELLAKAPRLEPKNASDKAVMESFRKAKPPDEKRGLYGKYSVERADGRSCHGEKHEDCRYFVLDLVHDKHAIPAILAYAKSCEADYPALAKDLHLIYACHECKENHHCEGQTFGCKCECPAPF